MYQNGLKEFLQNYDIIVLTETFTLSFPSHLFDQYTVFTSPGIRLSDSTTARLSGGIAILVKKTYSDFVKRIHVEYDSCIVLKLSGKLTGLSVDCMLIGIYIPPYQSDYYKDTDIDNGLYLLEHCIMDIYEMYGETPLMVIGDLNARTGGMNAKDNVLPDDTIEDYTDHDERFTRKSKDTTTNNFGRYLLNMCEQFSLLIMNGLLHGDKHGDYTYIAHNGSSVIDYVLMSRSIFEHAVDLCVMSLIESKHLPVQFLFNAFTSEKVALRPMSKPKKFIEKFIWNQEKAIEYCNSFSLDNNMDNINTATELLKVDIDAAIVAFDNVIFNTGQCMKKTFCCGDFVKGERWFDSECRKLRTEVRHDLNNFRRCKEREEADVLRLAFSENRRGYKKLIKQKKLDQKQETLEILENCVKDPRKFWSTVSASIRKVPLVNSISIEDWYTHFQKVFNVDCDENVNPVHASIPEEIDVDNNVDTFLLDHAITGNEVSEAIKSLKNGKAAGPDGISGEFYKYSPPCVITFFTELFNKIFDSGTFPLSWSEAIIHPIHKKGDIGSPDNYRGISLLNISSKLYTRILNKRLTNWTEANNILNESQAGFRKSYSTVDHIFSLLATVQRQLSNHRKLYVAFIDFRKAFDLVDRNYLWYVLRKKGISCKMYAAIKSMYSVVKAKVRVNDCVSDSFMCPRGLKQGENCSPILFSLFINELAEDVSQNGRHGIPLSHDLVELFILLFADDVALMSYSVVGLQCQLNILCNTANTLGLTVNRDKSKIVVFRNGGHIAANERWFYNGDRLDVVNEYKYLGVIFSTRLSFSYSMEDMALRARKGVFGILRLLWSLGKNCPKLFFKMFDVQIQPILTYGCEVWGLSADHTAIERVHLFAIKRLLNVSIKTPTTLIYCETGRYPLYIQTYTRCIKYWLKLTRMEESRIPKKAYKMLYNLHCNNKKNWVSNIQCTLYRYGFGYVWENQGVANIKQFLSTLKQRLYDCHIQDLNDKLMTKERFTLYSTYSQIPTIPYYLNNITNPIMRKWLTRVRLGVSPLKPHLFRYSDARPNVDCPFCKNVTESEIHFILVCPSYKNLRTMYIPEKYHRRPNMFRLALLFADKNHCIQLAIFLAKAFCHRNNLISMQHRPQ